MGPTCGWQDPGGPQVGHVKFAIWDAYDNINQLILVSGQNQAHQE